VKSSKEPASVDHTDACYRVPLSESAYRSEAVDWTLETRPHERAGRIVASPCVAPLRVRVREGNYCEPDVMFMLTEHRERRTPRFWHGADLVMEVVSEDDPARDLIHKRSDYAAAGIPEYWIVDPRDRSVTVLSLDPATSAYAEAGRYVGEQLAVSILIPGFEVNVREVFDRPEAV